MTILERLGSFPFDSRFEGYDSEGYPIYDRAVGSKLLRETYKKFFTDGVFPNPSTNFKITRAESGLAINIANGTAIINGAMGTIENENGLNITLATEPPRGDTTYSVFLRYDENLEYRSLYVRIDESMSSSPAEPENLPGVKELRLGYITVKSGAAELSNATLVDERGHSVCPFAAPFEEIDVSGILEEVTRNADGQYLDFVSYLQANMSFVESALDGTTAGNLQNQINDLSTRVDNVASELAPMLDGVVKQTDIDGVTLEFTDKLRVKQNGIVNENIANGAIDSVKIASKAIEIENLSDSCVQTLVDNFDTSLATILNTVY